MPGDNYRYDLRSIAVDRNRDRDTKRKWGTKALNGQREGRSPTAGTDKARPFNERQIPIGSKGASKRCIDPQRRHTARHVKTGIVLNNPTDHRSGSDDSHDQWSDDSVPEDEGDVMYSYDAQKGPASGQEIFGTAVGRAVNRFEDGVTSRLVKDEYDVLDDAAGEGGDDEPSQTVEEDFEML